mmetsp:Transcript_54841/g.166020  ORF Transcript_54841/g.166020 Transcript_54841/m.166020 type:complete len:118 (+) Transcript_54841:145-498(+)
MHNDMILVCDSWPREEDSLPYQDVRSLLDFPSWPLPSFYVGSGSAWLPHSAFAIETYRRGAVHPARFRWLYVIPVMLTTPFVVALMVLAGLPLLLLSGVARMCGLRGSLLWREMMHF